MPPPPPSPLQRAAEALARVLATREAAERWLVAYQKALGPSLLRETEDGGAKVRLFRRTAEGSPEVLPWVSVAWAGAGRLGMVWPPGGMDQEGVPLPPPPRAHAELKLHHGRQSIGCVYGPDGAFFETSNDPNYPGRLVELPGVLKGAADPVGELVRFVAGLDDTVHAPARLHYPVPGPGGVVRFFGEGLRGCRRALHEGRVPPTARFVVADALEGRAVGWGTSLEEALAGYSAEVARALPEERVTSESCFDDYDDDGNLIARGELPLPPSQVGGEAGGLPAEDEPDRDAPPAAEVDPITGSIDFGIQMLCGPKADVPPIPKRVECVPHVIVPLESSPPGAPPQGRWVRLLGELGTTRHAVRLKDGDGFLLVGVDLLGFLDLRTLRQDLDRLDVEEPGESFPNRFPESERFVRCRVRDYVWRAATPLRPEGLAPLGPPWGVPHLDGGSLDGDTLQRRVHRQHRVLRPVD